MKKQNQLFLWGKWGVLVVLLLIATFSGKNASAVEAQMPFSVNVVNEALLSLTIDGATNDGVVVNVTPNSWDGVFSASDDLDVTVTTNNRYGFTLGMTTTSSDLAPEVDNGYVIESVDASENGYTSANFPVNKWGYALKTNETFGNYFAVGDGVELQNSDTAALAGSTSTLKFGVKVDPFIPSGSYETTIVFTATTKPQILYMQDVAEWGSSVALGESVKAVDSRDMKEYWVTRVEVEPATDETIKKLQECEGEGANEVCTQLWMTQNLDFDLTANASLTSEDTDLGYLYRDYDSIVPQYTIDFSWTPQVATTSDVSGFTATTSAERSLDLGDVYYFSSGNNNDDDIVYTSLEACVIAGHTEGECKHYHAGNLYNFYTATAGATEVTIGNNQTSETENQVVDMAYENSVSAYDFPRFLASVCPAGWRLPWGQTTEISTRSEFDLLLYKNDVTPTADSAGTNIGFTTNGFVNLRTSPIWFTRAGAINGGYGTHSQAERGMYWSNVATDADNASGVGFGYSIDHGGNYIFPSGTDGRVNGYSVRCIAWTDTDIQDIAINISDPEISNP